MKAYTDLEQSRKLAEIMLSKNADMWWGWCNDPFDEVNGGEYTIEPLLHKPVCNPKKTVPCWSLAALLDILDKAAYFMNEDASVNLSSYKTIKWTVGIDNSDLELVTEADPVSACVEMIIKLHEQKVL